MKNDPVCGMEVDPTSPHETFIYEGELFYFCSSSCKEAFERNPEVFAGIS
jgi:YHS domain-containing protein